MNSSRFVHNAKTKPQNCILFKITTKKHMSKLAIDCIELFVKCIQSVRSRFLAYLKFIWHTLMAIQNASVLKNEFMGEILFTK